MSVTYIHYGHDKYEYDKVQEYTGALRGKPDKGLWASRVDANYGWKNWCKDNDYMTESLDTHFKFTLSDGANILEIHDEDDILPYIIRNPYGWKPKYNKTDLLDGIDREKLYEEYDGMELFISDNYNTLHDGVFNSWDCDSICVWNPEVIIPL